MPMADSCPGQVASGRRVTVETQTRASSSLTSLWRSSELRLERSMRLSAVLRTSEEVSALQKPIVSLRCRRASFRTLSASSKVSSFKDLASSDVGECSCIALLSAISGQRPEGKPKESEKRSEAKNQTAGEGIADAVPKSAFVPDADRSVPIRIEEQLCPDIELIDRAISAIL